MFDLVSTNPNVDPQTRGCARLLAAIIAAAVSDAATPITANERRQERNIVENTDRAIRFLFDDEKPEFRLYAKLIGTDADAMRKALLDPAPELEYEYNARFPASARATVQARLRFYKQYERYEPQDDTV